MKLTEEVLRAWQMSEEGQGDKTWEHDEGGRRERTARGTSSENLYEVREAELVEMVRRLTGRNEELVQLLLSEKAINDRLQQKLLAADALRQQVREQQLRLLGEGKLLKHELLMARRIASSLSGAMEEREGHQQAREDALLAWNHLLEEQASESSSLLEQTLRRVRELEAKVAALEGMREEEEAGREEEKARLLSLERQTAEQERTINTLNKHKQQSERFLRSHLERLVERLQHGEQEKVGAEEVRVSPPKSAGSPPRSGSWSRRRDVYTPKTYEEMRRQKEEAERHARLGAWQMKQLLHEHATVTSKLTVAEAERDELLEEVRRWEEKYEQVGQGNPTELLQWRWKARTWEKEARKQEEERKQTLALCDWMRDQLKQVAEECDRQQLEENRRRSKVAKEVRELELEERDLHQSLLLFDQHAATLQQQLLQQGEEMRRRLHGHWVAVRSVGGEKERGSSDSCSHAQLSDRIREFEVAMNRRRREMLGY